MLQQLRAEKRKLQQSRLTSLVSSGRATLPAPLDPPRLEAPRAPHNTMDRLLARLESLEVSEAEAVRGRLLTVSYLQERRSEVGVMTVREDGLAWVVKVTNTQHSFYN